MGPSGHTEPCSPVQGKEEQGKQDVVSGNPAEEEEAAAALAHGEAKEGGKDPDQDENEAVPGTPAPEYDPHVYALSPRPSTLDPRA
jgi:hypothetical protein